MSDDDEHDEHDTPTTRVRTDWLLNPITLIASTAVGWTALVTLMWLIAPTWVIIAVCVLLAGGSLLALAALWRDR